MYAEIVVQGECIRFLECCAWEVKEHSWYTANLLSRKKMSRSMINTNMEDKIHLLNEFAPNDFMRPVTGSSGIILRLEHVDLKHLKVYFGAFCHACESTKNNTSKSSSAGDIDLQWSIHGPYYSMDLSSGRRTRIKKCTEFTVTDEVIARVEAIAARNRVSGMIDIKLNF